MENLEAMIRFFMASGGNEVTDIEELFSSLMESFSLAVGNRPKFENILVEVRTYLQRKPNLVNEWKTLKSNAQRFEFFSKILGYNAGHCEKPYAAMPYFPPYPVDKDKMPEEIQEIFKDQSISFRNEGNEKFKSGQFSSALNDYNASIAHAPNSECLSMGYANRSVVLLKMELPHASLADIYRAFEHGYPRHLQFKLYMRQGECLKALKRDAEALHCYEKALQALEKDSGLKGKKKREWVKKINSGKTLCSASNPMEYTECALTANLKQPPIIPPLSYGGNSELPCASKAVDLKYNKQRGRHLVANRGLKLGDVVVVERALAAVLLKSSDFIWTQCSSCFQRCQNLIPCKRCKMAMYCNEDCKLAASASHRIECLLLSPVMSVLNAKDFATLAPILLVRLLSYAGIKECIDLAEEAENNTSTSEREKGFTGGQYVSNLTAFFSLESNVKSKDVFHCVSYGVMSVLMTELMKVYMAPSNELGGTLFYLLNLLSSNSCEILETYRGVLIELDRYTLIGKGIFPTFSLVNHSCDPNVTICSHGDTLVARVIKPIAKGEELVTSYVLNLRFQYVDKASRQTTLQSQYCFDCKCEACVKNWPLRGKLPFLPNLPGGSPYAPAIAASAAKVEPHKLIFVKNDVLNKDTAKVYSDHATLLYKAGGRLSSSYNECARGFEQYCHRQANYYKDKWL